MHGESDSKEDELKEELKEIRADEAKLIAKLESDEKLAHGLEHELEHERHEHRGDHIELIFIINGEDFKVTTRPSDLLRSAVEKALLDSGNTGRRDPSEWEVRDSSGALLEMNREIKALRLHNDARLFLSLKVGAGGTK
jgi:hypothetical protein